MKISKFINSDFKSFSRYDNVRSIPSIIDGLKDSQRKSIYGMMCSGNKEIKVSQLAELTSMKTHYDHGGSSLEGTIIGLAQNYAGSNNVNMFEPIGQFGSILGSEAGAPRYIFTKPSQYMKKFFVESDTSILSFKEIEGEQVEPSLYWPTLPLWAVNGANGIGSGFKSLILPRSLTGVKKAITAIASNKKVKKEWLHPFYENWGGTVIDDGGRWMLAGKVERVNTTKLVITEIPAGMGIDKLKETLVQLMDSGDIKDFSNGSSEYAIKIELSVTRKFSSLADDEILKKLKLIQYVTEKLTFWDVDFNIVVYDSFEEALRVFVKHKLEKVSERKNKQIEIKQEEIDYFENLILFIKTWHSMKGVNKMTVDEIRGIMLSSGVNEIYMDKLMAIRISSLSKDSIDGYNEKIKVLNEEITDYMKSSALDIYSNDLNNI